MGVKGIVSFKPLKNGKISVLMEVEANHENLIVLTNLYGQEGVLVSDSDLGEIDDKSIILKGLLEQTKSIYLKVLELYQNENEEGASPLDTEENLCQP